ncbi:zinc-dependent peptidase [Fulvivirga sp. 29W222]|uniref:Zinc-dependent peptidase n=1 Tax=Fulvivirga marina TaxID=2494733 RepID=A0A937G1L9_9BACT|nr:M90 family metallopeptidase [Fulvivirga marina]MBL6448932.1 zinc-dependent peptidase [Fulvivirga marina]
MEVLLIIIIVVATVAYLVFHKKKLTTTPTKLQPTPERWKRLLLDKVHFYRNLNNEQRLQFEGDIQNFLSVVRITGVQCEVTLEDRLLVASSATIPLFGFPAWTYKHLDEVLLYPDSFDRSFNIGSKEEIITGMVGSGAMEGKMILSKPSMHLGFDISNDKKNVGIHEFVHLFDKETGEVDGIPPGYEDKAYSLPWLEFVKEKTDDILMNQSDINPYGATNRQEFFAVAGEYFFERPHLMKKKHPDLYQTLSQIFNQDMTAVIDRSSFKKKEDVGRNDVCPCGSGLKYKKCCWED